MVRKLVQHWGLAVSALIMVGCVLFALVMW